MTTKIVSIDVGIRNLSFCFFESSDFRIIKWDNIDLTERDPLSCNTTGCKRQLNTPKTDSVGAYPIQNYNRLWFPQKN